LKPIKKLLIIGKTSPIGGVTVHVNRLLDSLKEKEHPYKYIELSFKNLPSIMWNIPKMDVMHIHSSRLSFMFLIAAITKFFSLKSILTYHAEIGVHKGVNQWFEKYAVKWINIPIMLNRKSLEFAQSLNPRAIQISSFIPPISKEKDLSPILINQIDSLKKRTDYLFCSNAFKRFTMPDGRDVYGIGSLIETFSKLPNLGLIISDPSGENKIYHLKKRKTLEVLKKSDCMIRATLTDGDSISIKEAIYLEKNIICSDVVSRPTPCTTYTNDDTGSNLFITIQNYKPYAYPEIQNLNGFLDIYKLYN